MARAYSSPIANAIRRLYGCGLVEIREIRRAELPRWVDVMRAVLPDQTGTVDDYVDWKRQARELVWLLASDAGADVGAAVGLGGWHEPPGVARGGIRVIADARGRGVGSALLARVGAWASALGYGELIGEVQEVDEESLRWIERRGFVEVGRSSRLVLELAEVDEPPVDPPEGVEIVSWAACPGIERGLYAMACEAYPDVPGEEEDVMLPFEEWLSADMNGTGDRPEATFAALAGADVVAYAKLSLSAARPAVAYHDMTGVLRAWRGRGIAGALKRAEIAWAKRNGYARLETLNEERNEPIRRLNERHGYRPEPGEIVVRGPTGSASHEAALADS